MTQWPTSTMAKLQTPMLWFIGFIVTFTVGGMTGVMMAIPGIDFQAHNSLFLVAHFHTVIIGGVVFGFFAGFTYWFPKFVGFKLNEKYGTYAFWGWVIGFLVAFLPLYVLGAMGASRRLNHYGAETGWQPLFIVAGFGVLIILTGFAFQLLQIYVSIRDRKDNMDTTGDPWGGRTLEWSTTSPPPFYNFAIEPEVHRRDPWWMMKQEGNPAPKTYSDIHMPKNNSVGFLIGIFSCIFGFAMVWWMFWLAALTALAMVVTLVVRLFVQETEYVVSKDEIARIEAGGDS